MIVRTVEGHLVESAPYAEGSTDCRILHQVNNTVIGPPYIEFHCNADPYTGILLNGAATSTGFGQEAHISSITNITDQLQIVHNSRYKFSAYFDLHGAYILATASSVIMGTGTSEIFIGATLVNTNTGTVWDSGPALVFAVSTSCTDVSFHSATICVGGGRGFLGIPYSLACDHVLPALLCVRSPWLNLTEGTYQWEAWMKIDVEASSNAASGTLSVIGTANTTWNSPTLVFPVPNSKLSYVEVTDEAFVTNQCADHAPPITNASPTGLLGDNSWYRSAVSITLSASDASGSDCQSGVDTTFYRVDGSSWNSYSGSFTITHDGRHKVEFYSIDKAGNIEDPKAVEVLIDSSPPTGVVHINNDAVYTSSPYVTLVASATDGPQGSSGIQMIFRNSGGTYSDWMPYSTGLIPWTLSSGDGDKSVCVQFKDAAGNVDTEYCRHIFLDTTPPATPNPKAQVIAKNGTVTFSWSPSADAGSGVAGYIWRVDAGNEAFTASGSVNLPSLVGERHVFYVRAEDNAGLFSSWGSVPFGANAPTGPRSLLDSIVNSSPPWIFIPGAFAVGLFGVVVYRKKVNGRLSKRP